VIQPKYEIGQQVWVVDVRDDVQSDTCPDCLGTKHWPITVPGGDTFDLECATCRYGFEVRGFVSTHVTITIATQMTVGSILINTSSDQPVTYMMNETGVGSGQIWSQADVFATKADAQPRLKEKQAEIQSEHDVREAARIAHNKKSCHKPSYDKRCIRELEKKVRVLTKS